MNRWRLLVLMVLLVLSSGTLNAQPRAKRSFAPVPARVNHHPA